MTTLNKGQQREVSKILAYMPTLGADFGARALSALYRSAMKASQQDEILELAAMHSLISSDEFIIR
jgi:hypothetical protein